jgi:DNA-binding protein HU-beta
VTKTELVSVVADKAGLTKADADRAVKALLDAVTDCLKSGDKLSIVGFGTFSVSKRAARTGKNPKTLAKIEIPAANTPRFKAGKALRDSVN